VPLGLIKIKKPKWYKKSGVPWLCEGDLQADALGDLRTKNNTLSVWCIDDNKTNLRQIVAALAANPCSSMFPPEKQKTSLEEFDYALFDLNLLSELSIKFDSSRGNTVDEVANVAWHIDLKELTASKLLALATGIRGKGTVERINEWDVEARVAESVRLGHIKLQQLNPSLAQKLQPLIQVQTDSETAKGS
jgi:hypothetical protein